MRRRLVLLLLGALVSGSLAENAARADVLVEPTPPLPADPVTTWRRGETRRMYVWAHNNGPEIVDGGNWKPSIPANLQGHLTNTAWGRPIPSEEIFSGASMFFVRYDPIGFLSGALVTAIGGGAQPGDSGYLQYYAFHVGNSAPLGSFDFPIDNINLEFLDDGFPATLVPRTVQSNYSFAIKPELGDANLDGLVNLADVGSFIDAILRPAIYTQAHGVAPTDACDMNGDGVADGNDIQGFVERIINGI